MWGVIVEFWMVCSVWRVACAFLLDGGWCWVWRVSCRTLDFVCCVCFLVGWWMVLCVACVL